VPIHSSFCAAIGTNVLIERLWRRRQYERTSLHALETGSELRAGLTRWIGYYNTRRPHSALVSQTPDEPIGATWPADTETAKLRA
jgi:putative transposase